MRRTICTAVLTFALSLVVASGSAFAAAGSPPDGPIKPVENGGDLKHACGQAVDGYAKVEGEIMLSAMLIVQCQAVVGSVVEMVDAGELKMGKGTVWQCVKNPTDQEALTAAFVTWVGRRPALLRKPAAVAFVEAVEMSERCR